jgi:magnesium transporter
MKISFMTKEEFLTSLSEYPYKKLFVKSLEEAAYCKTEFFSEGMFGILKIPDKRNLQGKFLIAAYYVKKGEIIFLDEDKVIHPVLEKRKELKDIEEGQELGILLAVLNGLIEDEVPYLQKIEEKITELEDILIVQPPRDFPEVLTRFRRAMTRLHGFYVQLLDVIEEIQGNLGERLSEEDETGWKNTKSGIHIPVTAHSYIAASDKPWDSFRLHGFPASA